MKVLFLVLVPLVVYSQTATIKLGFTEEAIIDAVGLFEGKAASIPLPDLSFDLSKNNLTLFNNFLKNTISANATKVVFSEPGNLTIAFSGVNTMITFNFTDKTVVTLNGTGIIDFPNSYYEIDLTFYTQNSILWLVFNNVNITMGTCKVTSNLPKALNLELQTEINNKMGTLEFLVAAEIMSLNDFFNEISTGITKWLPLPPLQVMLSLNVTEDPYFSADSTYVTLPLSGAIFKYPERFPIFPVMIPPMPEFEPGLPIQAMISEYQIVSLLTLAWTFIDFNISSLPSAIPFQLTTDGLAFILPGLRKAYGSGLGITMGLSASTMWGQKSITADLIDGGLFLQLAAELTFYVNVSPTNISYACTIHQLFNLTFEFAEENMVANFAIADMNMIDTKVQDQPNVVVDPVVYQKVLSLLVRTLLPILNAFGIDFVLPIPNLPLLNSVQLWDGYLLLQAGLKLSS